MFHTIYIIVLHTKGGHVGDCVGQLPCVFFNLRGKLAVRVPLTNCSIFLSVRENQTPNKQRTLLCKLSHLNFQVISLSGQPNGDRQRLPVLSAIGVIAICKVKTGLDSRPVKGRTQK